MRVIDPTPVGCGRSHSLTGAKVDERITLLGTLDAV